MMGYPSVTRKGRIADNPLTNRRAARLSARRDRGRAILISSREFRGVHA